MRKYACAIVAIGLLEVGCSQSNPCKPNTVVVNLACPEGFSEGTFEVSLSRDNAEFTKLEPPVVAVCPQTVLELNLAGYTVQQAFAVRVVAVDSNGKRFALSHLERTLAKGCTAVSSDDFTTVAGPDEGDGSAVSDDGGRDAGDEEACSPNEKRCRGQSAQSCVDSKWVTSEECPNLCRDGLCSGQCKPGAKSCQFTSPVTCKEDGTLVPGEPCANLCKGGECVGECQPRVRRCNGNIPELCDETGAWKAEAACSTMCSEGFCGGCTKGETMCNGDTPFTCDSAGKWVKGDACPFFCSAAMKKCDGVCKPGMIRCGAGQKVETCDLTGQWKAADAACSNICKDGVCAGECKPGASVCAAGNTTRLCGQDGIWTTGSKCEFVCRDGACIGACTPNDSRCNPNGGSLQVCTADGAWMDAMSCGSGCLNKACNDCSPGVPRCTGANNNDAQTCDSNGKWGVAMTCPTGCSKGGCNACSGGTRCTDDGKLQACVGGAWGAPTSCDGKGCLDKRCNACTPKAQRCESNVAYVCKDDGSGETQEACASGCSASGPVCNKCQPSGKRCSTDLATAYVCNGAGTSESASPCGALLCNTTTKVCNVCEPSKKTCSGTQKRQCAADGSAWVDGADCGANNCNATTGECYACPKDGRRCSSTTPPYGNLERCSTAQSGWELAATCQQPAGCNTSTLQCNACVPGSPPRCKSSTEVAKCRDDGTREDVTTCGGSQYCSSGACVACPAAPSVCTGVGSFCSGTTVIRCDYNSNNCLVQTGSTSCQTQTPANGAPTCSNGTCGYTCPGACVANTKKCGPSGGVQTCGTQTCPAFGAEVACPARQSCANDNCACTVDPICTSTNSACSADGKSAVACASQNGCFYQSSSTPCAGPPGGNGVGQCAGAGVCQTKCNDGFSKCADGTCRTECPALYLFPSDFGCPRALNDDGQVVISTSGFKWTQSGGSSSRVPLALPSGTADFRLMAISGDGKVVVGYATSATSPFYTYSYRWEGTMSPVRIFAQSSRAYVTSSNGDFTAGVYAGTDPIRWAKSATWPTTTYVDVGGYATPFDITPTGDAVIIRGFGPGSKTSRWTAAAGNVQVSLNLPVSISTDGTQIFGTIGNGLGLWKDGAVTDLPAADATGASFTGLPSGSEWAADESGPAGVDPEMYRPVLDMSGDAKKALGLLVQGTTHEAGLWVSGVGVKKLSDVLTAAGVAVSIQLKMGTAISRDGKVVIGCGGTPDNPKGFRAVLP